MGLSVKIRVGNSGYSHKILSLPESFMILSGKMHDMFTEPSFYYFTKFIKGILMSSSAGCAVGSVRAEPALKQEERYTFLSNWK